MFLVHWGYALANIGVVFIVWLYIGHANPAVKPGISAEFKLFTWLKNIFFRLIGKRVQEYEQIVVTPLHPGVEVISSQMNEENEDFSSRKRYHQSSTIQGYSSQQKNLDPTRLCAAVLVIRKARRSEWSQGTSVKNVMWLFVLFPASRHFTLRQTFEKG
uniref:Uncharacterized protein n=1 Tax=Timema cristinae TaxID=61476 RepID=A0A7R9H5D3_TIMCR|nr:unnamed protein product [Timema cristinae]